MNIKFKFRQVFVKERLITLFMGLMIVLIAFAAGAGLVAGQEPVEGGCPLIEEIDDMTLETPQVDPDCQANQLASPILSPEADINEVWTSVGSAGTVDEADLGIVVLNNHAVGILAGSPLPTVLNIRYNVVAVDGLHVLTPGWGLRARFRDASTSGQRVILQLKRYNLTTGANSTLMTLDSNAWPPSPSPQTRTVSACNPWWGFNFSNYAYFVDATLIRDIGSPVASPVALFALQIRPDCVVP